MNASVEKELHYIEQQLYCFFDENGLDETMTKEVMDMYYGDIVKFMKDQSEHIKRVALEKVYNLDLEKIEIMSNSMLLKIDNIIGSFPLDDIENLIYNYDDTIILNKYTKECKYILNSKKYELRCARNYLQEYSNHLIRINGFEDKYDIPNTLSLKDQIQKYIAKIKLCNESINSNMQKYTTIKQNVDKTLVFNGFDIDIFHSFLDYLSTFSDRFYIMKTLYQNSKNIVICYFEQLKKQCRIWLDELKHYDTEEQLGVLGQYIQNCDIYMVEKFVRSLLDELREYVYTCVRHSLPHIRKPYHAFIGGFIEERIQYLKSLKPEEYTFSESVELSNMITLLRDRSSEFLALEKMILNRDYLVRNYLIDIGSMNDYDSTNLNKLLQQDWEIIRELEKYENCNEQKTPFLTNLQFICPVYSSNSYANILQEIKFILSFEDISIVCNKQTKHTQV